MITKVITIKEIILRWGIYILLNLSKPISTPQKNTDVACISKIGHMHVLLYLIMIKSLFFNIKINLPLTLVDDGTLTMKDKAMLHQHIQNLQIITRKTAKQKISTLLSKYPYSLKYYRGKSSQLFTHNQTVFETIYLHNHNRFIAIDADIIFFHKPNKIIQWITSKSKDTLALSFEPSYTQKEIQWGRLVLRALASKWRNTIPLLFNDGVLCSSKDTYSLPILERCLKHIIYPLGIQNHWLSIVILHAAIFASPYKGIHQLTFLDWKAYRIATRKNTKIHNNTDTLVALHYIAGNKQFWAKSALTYLMKTYSFRTKPL